MGVCNYVNQRGRIIGKWNRESFKGVAKRKGTHEEIEFHNSIQDWVFTSIYRL